MDYDVTIVGAGPAGLMAAKRAAKHGLKVILIEKRKDIANVTRACCQHFIMDEDYEKEGMKVDGEKIEIQDDTKEKFDVIRVELSRVKLDPQNEVEPSTETLPDPG